MTTDKFIRIQILYSQTFGIQTVAQSNKMLFRRIFKLTVLYH